MSISEIRHLIRTLAYVVTSHAADELDDDKLNILDLESIVLTGRIVAFQRDRVTREVKHVVQGPTLAGDAAEVVVKQGRAGRLVVITVYRC
jgi:hypothetical protein